MNSDWETARRFALRHSPAGYVERYAHNSQLPHTLHTPKDFQT
jgi:hypothetical protein